MRLIDEMRESLGSGQCVSPAEWSVAGATSLGFGRYIRTLVRRGERKGKERKRGQLLVFGPTRCLSGSHIADARSAFRSPRLTFFAAALMPPFEFVRNGTTAL